MPTQYLHSGEPLPTAPSLTGESEHDVTELLNFHTKILDYLRRLSAKLSSDIYSPPQIVSVESIALTLSGNFTPVGTDIIDWDQIVRMDAPFSYSVATPLTGEVTFLQAGFYLCLLDFYAGDTNYTVQFVDGDGNTPPYGDGTAQYNAGFGNQCLAVPLHMHKNQTLKVQVTALAAAVEALYSRWTILKLGDFPSGSGGTGVDPCEFDIWQLCP